MSALAALFRTPVIFFILSLYTIRRQEWKKGRRNRSSFDGVKKWGKNGGLIAAMGEISLPALSPERQQDRDRGCGKCQK